MTSKIIATHRFRVLLVEDDEVTRLRLASVIEPNASLELVGSVGTMREADRLIDTKPFDILLTDLDLPDGNGIELIRRVAAMDAVTSLVVTVFGDEKHVLDAIKAGASGYLLKDGGADDISQAILDVQNGGSPISPSIARYLLKHFQPRPKPEQPADSGMPVLTGREKEVIELIAKGFTYSEIAGLLNLSVHTVTSHIKNTYKKLSVSSRGEAVYEAMQLGLIYMEND